MAESNGVQKLAEVLKPMFDKLEESFLAQCLELRTGQNDLGVRLTAVEASLASKKRATGGRKTNVGAKAAAGTPKFANNSRIWFLKEFGNSEDFRAKYLTDELEKTALEDEKVQKKEGVMRWKAIGVVVWNHIKENDKNLLAELKEEYKDLKAKYEAKMAEPQLPPDPGSPKADAASLVDAATK